MKIREKAIASGIHFSASVLVFGIFIFLLLTYWYPSPYFTASGGWQGLKLVVLVDLVLGPLLTFIVFNKLKSRRELTIDFGFIIAIQLTALIWGIITVHQQRPVATVFWDDRFYTVPDNALSGHYAGSEAYQQLLSRPGIPFLYARKPDNMNDYNNMMQLIKDQNLPPHHQIERYEPFEPRFSTLKFLSLDIHEIIATNSEMKHEFESMLASTDTTMDDNVYLQLESRYQNIVLVFNVSGQHLGYIKAPYTND